MTSRPDVHVYASPAAFKVALEHRVAADARAHGFSVDRRRQLLLFDRLLGRLAREFGDALIAKGGVVLELRLARARTTRDVDVRLAGEPSALLTRLQAVGRSDFGDSLTFLVERPREGNADSIGGDGVIYEGQRFRVEARLSGLRYGSPFGLDVAFGDPVSGTVDAIDGTGLLSFVGAPASRIRLYPRETHLAEKLHAYTLPRPYENSRLKDLPDMGLLAGSGPFDADELRRALQTTFEFRKSHPLPSTLPAPPAAWAARYRSLARNDGLPWPTLAEAFDAARAFVNPVLGDDMGEWDPSAWTWRAHHPGQP